MRDTPARVALREMGLLREAGGRAWLEVRTSGTTGRPRSVVRSLASWEDSYDHLTRLTGTTAEDRHRWNAVALAEAEQVSEPARVAAFLPSLHLNLGHSCEELGRTDAAREHYRRGRAGLDELDAGPYTAVVRGGLEAAAQRVGDEPAP